jgi:hypothetical protein
VSCFLRDNETSTFAGLSFIGAPRDSNSRPLVPQAYPACRGVHTGAAIRRVRTDSAARECPRVYGLRRIWRHEATTAGTPESRLGRGTCRCTQTASPTTHPGIGSRSLERSLMAASAAPAASLPVAVQIRENVATLADSPPLDELSDEPSPKGGTVALKLVVSAHGANGSDHCLSSRLSCRQKERPSSPSCLTAKEMLSADSCCVRRPRYSVPAVKGRREHGSRVGPPRRSFLEAPS